MFWIWWEDNAPSKEIEEKQKIDIIAFEQLELEGNIGGKIIYKDKEYIFSWIWVFYNEDSSNYKNNEFINPEDGVFYSVYDINRYCIYTKDHGIIEDKKWLEIIKWYNDEVIPLKGRFVDNDGDFSYFQELVAILLPNEEKTKEFLINNPCFLEENIPKDLQDKVILKKIELKKVENTFKNLKDLDSIANLDLIEKNKQIQLQEMKKQMDLSLKQIQKMKNTSFFNK